jgi:hypothetical protein
VEDELVDALSLDAPLFSVPLAAGVSLVPPFSDSIAFLREAEG